MVQDTLSVGIRLIQTLPEDNERELTDKANKGKQYMSYNFNICQGSIKRTFISSPLLPFKIYYSAEINLAQVTICYCRLLL